MCISYPARIMYLRYMRAAQIPHIIIIFVIIFQNTHTHTHTGFGPNPLS